MNFCAKIAKIMTHCSILLLVGLIVATFLSHISQITAASSEETSPAAAPRNYVHGIDISAPCSASGLDCLRKAGYSFAIVRCYRSLGKIDEHCASSVKAAHAARFDHVDIYVFPDQKKGNGKAQIEETVAYMKREGASYGMLWLDIEGPGLYWSSSHSTNRAFFRELVDGIKSTGVRAGVYTSKSQWEPIMGSDFTEGSEYPLWYAHYSKIPDPSMHDFVPFSGWHKGSIKQYAGSRSICGCSMDLNAY